MTAESKYPMSHSDVTIQTSDSETIRTMPDTAQTEAYIQKLSFAAAVTVRYATGEYRVIECGRTLVGGMIENLIEDREDTVNPHTYGYCPEFAMGEPCVGCGTEDDEEYCDGCGMTFSKCICCEG